MMPVIDAYAHVGLPRFQTVEDYEQLMAQAGIDRAVLSSFDSSPDLAAVHDALTRAPDRYRGIGVPLGSDEAEMRAAIDAQLAAGFSGLRLTDGDIRDRPWILDMLARERRLAIVVGNVSSPECAAALARCLGRHPDMTIIGGHFAGIADPTVLKAEAVADLFSHPRFFVVFSRQGAWPRATVKAWAEAVLAKTGWDRVLWGSEAPVLLWRNETIADAIGWVDTLAPSLEQKAAFLGENARALFFDDPVSAGPLDLPFDPAERRVEIPATMWARALPIEQSIAGRLVHDWYAAGAKGALGEHLESLLDQILPPLPKPRGKKAEP